MDKIVSYSNNPKIKIKEQSSTVSEPETFDTWTIISDPINSLNKNVKNDTNGNRIEILRDDIPETKCHNHDNIDELSDGISIISDSESAGRNSPQPFYSSDDKQAFEIQINKIKNETKETQYEPITPPITPPKLRETSSQTLVNSENVENRLPTNRVQRFSQERRVVPENLTVVENSTLLCFSRRNISVVFYISALIAAVALIGKLKYPQWIENSQGIQVNQRVYDLELQNNLLRAEIDILSKKVNFLSQNTENTDKTYKYDEKKPIREERVKVWPGGGHIEKTEIPKKSLKMPHSCDEPGQNFKGICTNAEYKDNKYHEKNSYEKLEKSAGSLNIDVLQERIKNVILEAIEKIIPMAMRKNIESIIPEMVVNNEKPEYKNEENYKYKYKHENGENLQKQKRDNRNFNTERQQFEQQHPETKINDRKPDKNFDHKYSSEETSYKKEAYKNKNSGEAYKRDSKERYAKENYDKKDDTKKDTDKFKKNFNDFEQINDNNYKQKANKDKKYEDWHEKIMKHREEHRKLNHDKRKSDNWYIELANSREEARLFDKDEYKFKKMRRR